MTHLHLLVLFAALALGCGQDAVDAPDTAVIDVSSGPDSSTEPDSSTPPDGSAPDASTPQDMGAPDLGEPRFPACVGQPCPIEIPGFPYRDARDTTGAASQYDSYPACAPQNESGPEIAYVFRLDEPGTIMAGVTSGAGADVDIHLLADLSAESCLRRGDIGLSAHLTPGIYYLAVDSFVSASGAVNDGPYDLFVDFFADTSPCAMRSGEIPRIGTDDLLPMPATGRVVLEAHLMTMEEHESNLASAMTEFPMGWPTSFTDRITEHYALATYAMNRMEPWAPCCEPSNEFGQGSTARPPAEAEAWYINMRWRTAPTRGERYIVVNPQTGEAIVAAAGYENGPGDLSRIGGACEEVHDVMGTGHLGTLTFGSALDQQLAYGPINCHP